MTDIIDFGDNCLPHILIRDILFLKQKTLFTLGIYGFNDILNYLKDETYEDIYKKEYLTYNGAPIADFHSKYQFYTQSPKIINTKYNFGFMHHFNLDVSNNCINNYDYVVGQFNTKIAEFKKGEVLVTEMTDPDWEPIMKIASAIVTDKGGRTSHAAIVSRELGIP